MHCQTAALCDCRCRGLKWAFAAHTRGHGHRGMDGLMGRNRLTRLQFIPHLYSITRQIGEDYSITQRAAVPISLHPLSLIVLSSIHVMPCALYTDSEPST